jgi:PST family polysaccharide transporter
MCKWRPTGFPRHFDKSLLGYGRSVIASELGTYVARNSDNLLIGWVCGTRQLGFYDRAYTIGQIPLQQGLSPIFLVAHSALSRVLNDPGKYRQYASAFMTVYAALGMAAAAYLFSHAALLISVLLGDAWLPAIDILRALAPSIFIDSIIIDTHMLLLSHAHTTDYFKGKTAAAVFAVIAFFSGIHWGPVGVAIAFSISRLFVLAYGCVLVKNCMSDAISIMCKSILVPMVSSVLACATAMYAQSVLHFLPWQSLCLSTITFAVVCACPWLLSPSERKRLLEVRSMLKS